MGTTNQPASAIPDDEALAEIEATNEVYRIDWRYPNQKERVRALVQTVRAMQGLLQMADYAAEEYKRQAEAVVAEVQRERDELREQLAKAQQRRGRDIQLIRDRAASYGDEEGLSRVLDTLADELERSE